MDGSGDGSGDSDGHGFPRCPLKEVVRTIRVSPGLASWCAIDLADVWQSLISGRSIVDASLHMGPHCYLVLRSCAPATSFNLGLASRDLEILTAWLTQGSQKRVAIDYGLAPSSIATIIRRCLSILGVPCVSTCVPPVLVQAVHAKRGDAFIARSLDHQHCPSLDPWSIIEIERPDLMLDEVLPRAERAVVRLLVDGYAYADIASIRGSSVRTVANQIGAVFRRLNVSGRVELLIHLTRKQLASRTTSSLGYGSLSTRSESSIRALSEQAALVETIRAR